MSESSEIVNSVLNTRDIPLKMIKSIIVKYESVELREDGIWYNIAKPFVKVEFWNE